MFKYEVHFPPQNGDPPASEEPELSPESEQVVAESIEVTETQPEPEVSEQEPETVTEEQVTVEVHPSMLFACSCRALKRKCHFDKSFINGFIGSYHIDNLL